MLSFPSRFVEKVARFGAAAAIVATPFAIAPWVQARQVARTVSVSRGHAAIRKMAIQKGRRPGASSFLVTQCSSFARHTAVVCAVQWNFDNGDFCDVDADAAIKRGKLSVYLESQPTCTSGDLTP